ncbi:hypothetical protein TNCT_657311 [Trichonephila clavata]|uniref:Integrase catalytic domain-containing protein n=1 Tax=Trichonephila clavata TaxID=2740835 RepID=A0A8X6KA14_TRICU|nr:hypothetical protein TNCT_657311 [Trichonephila clavata]
MTVKFVFEVLTNVKFLTAVLLMLMICCSNYRAIPHKPWEIVSTHHVICLPQIRAGNINMLVHIDHATRYVVATPSAFLGVHSVTDALYHNIILKYGPPSMYISDRGNAFTACHTHHFLRKYKITQSMTPPRSLQFKQDADAMQNYTSDEENDSSAENQDPAEDYQEVCVATEPSSSPHYLHCNRRSPKRVEQYVP